MLSWAGRKSRSLSAQPGIPLNAKRQTLRFRRVSPWGHRDPFSYLRRGSLHSRPSLSLKIAHRYSHRTACSWLSQIGWRIFCLCGGGIPPPLLGPHGQSAFGTALLLLCVSAGSTAPYPPSVADGCGVSMRGTAPCGCGVAIQGFEGRRVAPCPSPRNQLDGPTPRWMSVRCVGAGCR